MYVCSLEQKFKIKLSELKMFTTYLEYIFKKSDGFSTQVKTESKTAYNNSLVFVSLNCFIDFFE